MGKTPQSLFVLDASRTEFTLFHVEISFASGIHSLNHFHQQLVSVIVGLAHKLLVEHIRAGSEVFSKQHRVKAAGKNPLAPHLLSLHSTRGPL
ncbi:MAG: hypothetical protein WBV90_16420 [Terrimicrobiaceae bacterium]